MSDYDGEHATSNVPEEWQGLPDYVLDENINLQPGDRFIVRDVDGTEYQDTVHSIHYRSARPEIRQHPTGWRRTMRNLTPHRWRKPLPVVHPYEPAHTEVVGMSNHRRRSELMADNVTRTLNRILR